MIIKTERTLFFLAILLVQVFHPSFSVEKGVQAVRLESDELSVNFREIPLTAALGQLAHQTGIDFFVDRALREKITVRFQKLPLEVGLRRILKNFNHAMILREDEEGVRIAGVKVYRKGQLALGVYDAIRGHSTRSPLQIDRPGQTSPNAMPGVRATNPRAVGAHGKIAQAISETYRNLSLLKRKAAAEERGIHQELAGLRSSLAQGEGDPAAGMKRIKTLEQQLARISDMGGQMIRNEVKNISQLRKQMVMVQSPEKMQREAMLRQQRAQRERVIKRRQAHDARNQRAETK